MIVADVTGDATVALAALTSLLALAALVSLRFTRRALAVAEVDSIEATKARIDQQAPRMTVIAIEAGSSTGPWRVDADHLPKLEPHQAIQSISGDDCYGISGWFRLFNDGRSTAIVKFPPGVLDFPDGSSLNEQKIKGRPTMPRRYPLRPEEVRLLFVWAARSSSEWNAQLHLSPDQREPLLVDLLATDAYQEGVRDRTTLALHGIPLVLSQGALVTSPEVPTSLKVSRTVREYPNLRSPTSPRANARSAVLRRLRRRR